MNRRDSLIAVLVLGAAGAPFPSLAQKHGKAWRVGFLSQRARPEPFDSDDFGGFPRGMRELGYIEGKNITTEWRFADSKLERLPAMAAELVQLKVDVIVSIGTPATAAAQKATTAIPIVMASISDPLGSGFVTSLARPNRNITGVANYGGDTSSKLLEMLISMVPKLSRVAVLINPANSGQVTYLKTIQTAALKAKVQILSLEVQNAQEIDHAFTVMARDKVGAVIVSAEGLFMQQQNQVAMLARKYRLPSASQRQVNVENGYLMSYGTNYADIFRRAATYVDKIFKGAKPSDLPVEQPTTFDLIINRNTAKALGLTIPSDLLVRATKVIE